MAPIDGWDQVDPRQHVAVLEAGAQAVAPGPVSGKALIGAVTVGHPGGHGVAGRAIARRTAAKGCVAPQALITEAIDVHHTHFAKQTQARGAKDVVDSLGRRARPLPHAHTLPGVEAVAIARIEPFRQVDPRTADSAGHHRGGGIRCVVGQRHVGPVAQLSGQRNAAVWLHPGQAHAIQANIFGECRSIGRPLYAAGETARQAGVTCIQGQVRQARVVVDEIQRRLGVVERRQHLAQREAKLTAVRRRFVAP
ncbi:hypothetical protein D3C78_1115180 [compost metagenome]